MRQTVADKHASFADSYSITDYSVGDSPDLEQRVCCAIRPGLRVVEVVTQVPQLGDADLSQFYDARWAAVTGASVQVRPGQPKRNIFMAGEVAYMADIELRPRILQASGAEGFDILSYTAPHLLLRPTDDDLAGPQRTLQRWVADGRKTLHDIGAWPWALVPEGRLPEEWWREQLFQDALDQWSNDQTSLLSR
jgi:hypothetical protein